MSYRVENWRDGSGVQMTICIQRYGGSEFEIVEVDYDLLSALLKKLGWEKQ